MHCCKYSELDGCGCYLSDAINSGLEAVNQTDFYYYFSSYGDSQFYESEDVVWSAADCSSSSIPFSDDYLDKDKVLQGVLELEDDLHGQHDIPSPPAIPTPVDEIAAEGFFGGPVTPPPQIPATNPIVQQRLNFVGGVRRRRQRQRQLWQFLLEILSDDKYSSIIHWVQRDEGVFRFVQPKSVAQLWGKRRRRQNMTYEHLSRAMRYYYKRGLMRRVVDLGRLVYQFLSNAEGWRDYTRPRDDLVHDANRLVGVEG